MPGEKEKDIIDIILNDNDDDSSSPDLKELDCFIYRSSTDMPAAGDSISGAEAEKCEVWEIFRENVSVKIWKSKAKIKVRFSHKLKRNISIKRIANIAVDAIVKELQKEIT